MKKIKEILDRQLNLIFNRKKCFRLIFLGRENKCEYNDTFNSYRNGRMRCLGNGWFKTIEDDENEG